MTKFIVRVWVQPPGDNDLSPDRKILLKETQFPSLDGAREYADRFLRREADQEIMLDISDEYGSSQYRVKRELSGTIVQM